ncbi:MAG: DUF1499 domain-containing protein [Desulforhopalus sp.]
MSPRTILFSLPLLSSLIACTMTPPAGELIDGRLRPCPNRPNCVTSDSSVTDSDYSVSPISFHRSQAEAWQTVQTVLIELGGQIIESGPTYAWATFSSTIFHFVDDVELRMEPQENRIHVRSGARIGYWDLGVNRKRVEKIRKLFLELSSESAETITR